MKQIQFILVTLMVAFINLNTGAAQLPGATTPNASTAPNASVAPPANPQAWCEAGGYCDGNAAPPPAATPPRVRRPAPPQWFVVINGDLEGSRQHGEVETDLGHTEYGIGGTIDCHEAETGNVSVVIAPSSLRYLQGETGHRFVAGTICLPRGSAPGPMNIDLSMYVTLVMFRELESTLFLHMCSGSYPNVSFESWFSATPAERNALCPDVDPAQQRQIDDSQRQIDDNLETSFRFECADRIEAMSGEETVMFFQQWESATPSARVELCPPVVVNNGDSEPNLHYRLRLGGQFLIGSSVDSTALTGGLGVIGAELLTRNERHALALRVEIGSANMRGTEGSTPLRRTTMYGGSLAYGYHPANWAMVTLGGRVLAVSSNGDETEHHGHRATLAGPELALVLDRPIRDGNAGVYLRLSGSFLRGQTSYFINGHRVRDPRNVFMVGFEGGFTFGR